MGQPCRGKKPMQRPLTRRCTGEYRGPRACAVRGLGYYLPAPLQVRMAAILASLAGLSQPNQAR